MNETTPRIRLLSYSASNSPRNSIAYVTGETYPFSAPYNNPSGEQRLAGRCPRIISIIFTTLINRQADCWNPNTRTLTLTGKFVNLCRDCGIYNGGNGCALIRQTLDDYCKEVFVSSEGESVTPIEHATFPRRGLMNTVITFTPEYVHMMTRNVRQVDIKAIRKLCRAISALDLLMLATSYAPEDQTLVIEASDLRSLLGASSTSTFSPYKLVSCAEQLNDVQSNWHFTYIDETLRVRPAGLPASAQDGIQLVYR